MGKSAGQIGTTFNIYCVFISHLSFLGGLVTKRCPTLAIPWTVAHQAPLSMGFSRQEYRSGSPFRSPGDLPDPGIEPGSPALQQIFYQLSHRGALVCFLTCWSFIHSAGTGLYRGLRSIEVAREAALSVIHNLWLQYY